MMIHCEENNTVLSICPYCQKEIQKYGFANYPVFRENGLSIFIHTAALCRESRIEKDFGWDKHTPVMIHRGANLMCLPQYRHLTNAAETLC